MDTDQISSLLNEKDYYKILGVDKTSTTEEIRKAYKRLAIKYHPDKNKQNKSEEVFKKISHAFSVLSDENKRQNYDNFGHEDGFSGNQSSNSFQKRYNQEDIDPFFIFQTMFGDGFQFGSNSFSEFTMYSTDGDTIYFTNSNSNERSQTRRTNQYRQRGNGGVNDDDLFQYLFRKGHGGRRNVSNSHDDNDEEDEDILRRGRGRNRRQTNANLNWIGACLQIIPLICCFMCFVVPYLVGQFIFSKIR